MSYLKRKKSSLENSILGVWKEAAKKEGNAFGMALQAAKENGDKKFTVNGKTYDVKKEQEKMDKVNKVALGKKFKDRKDKDIDNDGDVDDSDEYLHKRRQTVSKAIKKEGKMSDILITIDDIANAMKKDRNMKPFIDKFKKDAKKTLNPKKSLEKVLPDYIPGKDIAKLTKENYEVGTKARRDHTIETTPGQSKEDFEKQVEVMHKKKNSMREALAKMWGIDEGKNPFDKKENKKYNKKEGKTLTGKPETKIEVEPKMEKKK